MASLRNYRRAKRDGSTIRWSRNATFGGDGTSPARMNTYELKLGKHRISGRPNNQPDNLAFFDIRYPAGYQIMKKLDVRLS
jgi:hypothetical protein